MTYDIALVIALHFLAGTLSAIGLATESDFFGAAETRDEFGFLIAGWILGWELWCIYWLLRHGTVHIARTLAMIVRGARRFIARRRQTPVPKAIAREIK